MRLFDCLLAAHPMAILYFGAALVQRYRDALLELPHEMPALHQFLQRLPLEDLDVDEWSHQAKLLMQRAPPQDFLRSLPPELVRQLPATSPMLNYPHPWVKRYSGKKTSMSTCSDKGSPDDMWRSAPIYSGRVVLGGDKMSAVKQARILLRFLGVGGMALVAVTLSSTLGE